MDTMPQPYAQEFRDYVVRVALNRDEKTTIAQIAKDFGVHEDTIAKWLRQANIDAGDKPGKTTDESAELLRRRTRLLEQENEVLFRAAANLSQANLPSKGSTRS
jgi:transposase